jgi:hypothetical protein
MAEPMVDDKEESYTEDLRAFKVLRADAKRRFANSIRLVLELMADYGSRKSIQTRKEDLIGA